jgi:outer membrane protein TolC
MNERQQGERLRRQETQLETAKRLLNETRNRYSQGLTEYLPVLAALTTVQELERNIVSTRRDRISQRIILHRSLGGPIN